MTDTKTRTIDIALEVDATVEEVWRAVSDPAGLQNWFPLKASGGQGVGEQVLLSWGEGVEWPTTITIWEPNQRLRWEDNWVPEGMDTQLIVDIFIETKDGQTVVRLVHSGFAVGDKWDDHYFGVDTGWRMMLRNLKHYVEHHAGTPREMVHARPQLPGPRGGAWKRLFGGAAGLLKDELAGLAPGGSVTLALGPDMEFEGRVEALVDAHGNGIAISIPDLNNAFMIIELEPGEADTHCGLWLSTYGLPKDRVAALQTALTSKVKSILGAF